MKNVLFLTAALFSLTAFAQDSPINWGTQSKTGGSENSYFPIGYQDGHYYAVSLDNRAGILIDVDKNMSIAVQTPLITDQKKFDVDLMFAYNGMIHAISSEYSKDDKANNVYVTGYSFAGKQTGPNRKTILSVPMEHKSQATDFQYFLSADSSTMLILEKLNLKNDEMAKISFAVVQTKDYTKVWNASVDMPYADGRFDLLNAAVQNNGDMVIMASVKGDEGKRMEKYSTRIFSFTGKSKNFVEKEMKLEGKYISSARVQFITDKKVMATGFYNDLNDKGKSQGIEGAFMATANADQLESLAIKPKPLDEKTKLAVTHTGAFASLFRADEMNAYKIEVMNMNKDGSGYVIAEQQLIVERAENNSQIRTYYFNHLVLFRFDMNQEIQWISTIPKKQSTNISTLRMGIGPVAFWVFPGYLIREAYKYNSFVSTEKDGKIYILYNDHKDNGDARTVNDTKLMNNKNKALATLVTVDFNGKWNKTQLFRGKDLDVILDPSSCYVDNGKGFVISAERGKNLQFGKLDVK